MTVLLIGLICTLAAARALRGARPGAGWVIAVAVLVLLQYWTARNELARYRFSVVGLRYGGPTKVAANPADGAPESGGPGARVEIRIGGDADSDLYLRGAGSRDVVRLEASGDTARRVVARLIDDAAAVAVVERRDRFGRRRRLLLGGRPVAAGDTVVVTGAAGATRLVIESMPDTARLGGLSVPLPWTRRHRVRDAATGAIAVLPLSNLGWARHVTGRRPSLYARAYPLADVLAALDVRGAPPLTSFFYYADRSLALADLDSEVSAANGAASPPALTVWRAGQADRVTIAALPFRDYPELKLTLPERYGVRPLASYRVEAVGPFVDLRYPEPEVRVLERSELAARGQGLPVAGAEDAVRVRISHAANNLVRDAVVFESPPRAFGPGLESILLLPERVSESEMEVVTPAGATRWPLGRPISLGDAERATLLRVDGQAAGAGFWLLHLAVFGMVAALFALVRPAGAVSALSLVALGFVSIRLLLGASAHLEPPFVQEAQQLGLWLVPVLPWAVVAAGTVSAGGRGGASRLVIAVHASYAVAVVVLTLALFAGSPAKQAVLGLAGAGIGALVSLAPALAGRARRVVGAAGAVVQLAAEPRPVARRAAAAIGWIAALRGWQLGLLMLAGRIALDLAGWREGIELGGTRIAVSVVYTPAALVALAVLTSRWLDGLASGSATERHRTFAVGLLDIGAFLALAFVGVGFWISDFGIALATAPGALLALAWIGARAAGDPALGRRAAAAALLPLLVFVAAQAAPGLLAPVWAANAPAADAARLNDWNRNELLLLERGDPQTLRLIGQRRSEALAVMRETMRSYTRRNWFGRGFLDGRVSPEIRETATREHTVSALLASQWGLAGTAGLVLLLCALIPIAATAARGHDTAPPAPGDARALLRTALPPLATFLLAGWLLPPPYGSGLAAAVAIAIIALGIEPGLRRGHEAGGGRTGRNDRAPLPETVPALTGPRSPARARGVNGPALLAHAGALFLLTIACTGVYMVLANYGLVFFTGKNVYLFGLDSVSDALEALVLFAGAAGMLAVRRMDGAATRSRAQARTTARSRPARAPAFRRPESQAQTDRGAIAIGRDANATGAGDEWSSGENDAIR